ALQVDHLDDSQRLRVLEEESRALADDARDARGQQPVGRERLRQGCSGALLHDGVLTSHTSMQGRGEDREPSRHPVINEVLADIERRDADGELVKGRGHGKCAEVALLSDRLHQLDPTGESIRTPGDARDSLNGSIIRTLRIGDTRMSDGSTAEHGTFLPPCGTCGPLLKALNVTVHT
ncbi:MAG TPA: YwqJ-related putative deaminase, partial [Streptomyces sp.]|nr:YwqJ-related putative deaminase [Streptomyces sp.]